MRKLLLVFTDESGSYEKNRSDSFVRNHPFYVRSNVIIPFEAYDSLEEQIKYLKKKFGLKPCDEVKWSHYGNAIKRQTRLFDYSFEKRDFEIFFTEVTRIIKGCRELTIYYTMTNNREVGRVDDIKLIKMHLQNAFQKIQMDAKRSNAKAFIIADDLNKKNKSKKKQYMN